MKICVFNKDIQNMKCFLKIESPYHTFRSKNDIKTEIFSEDYNAPKFVSNIRSSIYYLNLNIRLTKTF